MSARADDIGLSTGYLSPGSAELFDSPADTLTTIGSPWIFSVARRLTDLLRLPSNWDSYGAPPISPRSAQLAADILVQRVFTSLGEPSISPTSAGYIQAEWRSDAGDLELEFVGETEINFAFEDSATGQIVEGSLSYDLRPLEPYIVQLTR